MGRRLAELAFAAGAAVLLTHDHVSHVSPDLVTEALLQGITPSRPWMLVSYQQGFRCCADAARDAGEDAGEDAGAAGD